MSDFILSSSSSCSRPLTSQRTGGHFLKNSILEQPGSSLARRLPGWEHPLQSPQRSLTSGQLVEGVLQDREMAEKMENAKDQGDWKGGPEPGSHGSGIRARPGQADAGGQCAGIHWRACFPWNASGSAGERE